MAPKSSCIICLSHSSSPQTLSTCKYLDINRGCCKTRLNEDNLQLSPTYYMASASKVKILVLANETTASDKVEQRTPEAIINKKVELILSIKSKLDDLRNIKILLDAEIQENENLGKLVNEIAARVCNPREEKKYNLFVQDADKIFNLLHSLSERLARVENAIKMVPSDINKDELIYLQHKRRSLLTQFTEAEELKEFFNMRQEAVLKMLKKYFNKNQLVDFEYYLNMKTSLIAEHHECYDKIRLGNEQILCLKASLPEEWQIKVDRRMEEE